MLDHHNAVAQIDQTLQDIQQFNDVVEVQSCGRFIKQIERATGVGSRQFGSQLDALGFTTGKRRRTLSQCDVVQPDIADRLQDMSQSRLIGKQRNRFADRHVQHVADRTPVQLHRQDFFLISLAATLFTLDPNVGQEMHFNPAASRSFASFTATGRNIKAEVPRR